MHGQCDGSLREPLEPFPSHSLVAEPLRADPHSGLARRAPPRPPRRVRPAAPRRHVASHHMDATRSEHVRKQHGLVCSRQTATPPSSPRRASPPRAANLYSMRRPELAALERLEVGRVAVVT